MISKELLSEVLGNYDFNDYTIINNKLRYHRGHYGINIHELAHKCKEWAFSKGYTLESASIPKGNFTSSYCVIMENTASRNCYSNFAVHGDTEQEAIFKACEWILKEIK